MINRFRIWWQLRTGEEETPFDGDTPAWVVSMLVHLGLLGFLTAITLYAPAEEYAILLSTDNPAEQEEELITSEEFVSSEEKVDQIGANNFSGKSVALAEAPLEAEISEVPVEPFETEIGISMELSDASLAVAPNESDQVVRGAQGVGTSSVAGAIDRLTHEILLSLEQQKTLVVWLFDQSGSLQHQREKIHNRMDRVYRELGVVAESGNQAFAQYEEEQKPLLTAVVAFGKNYQLMTPQPTDNLKEIKGAVAAIKNDPSGIENVFLAVTKTANRFVSYRVQEDDRRNVIFIVFSDEVGDDQQRGLDPTVRLCRRYQIPVYVVGVPAPFGRRDVEIKYVDPDPEYDQTPQWISVQQGPESFMPERVRLAFIGSEGRDDPIDSGFGPYSLTRLCYETGGIYFAVHPNRNQGQRDVHRHETAELAAHIAHFVHPAKMRGYRPDYVPAKRYKQLLASNKARMALFHASQLSWTVPMDAPRLDFPKQSEAALAGLLSRAQRDAAQLEPKVQRIYDVLATGERDRPKLTRLRWQAGYDLAMGRTLAVLVRTKAFNAMLAKAKQGMKFKGQKSDTWVLKAADEISVGSVLDKQAKRARMYLNRVTEEHDGTPWAMLAARELKDPIGWKWTEEFRDVNRPVSGDGEGAPKPDARKMIKKPKRAKKPRL